jgi:hypothetical protein
MCYVGKKKCCDAKYSLIQTSFELTPTWYHDENKCWYGTYVYVPNINIKSRSSLPTWYELKLYIYHMVWIQHNVPTLYQIFTNVNTRKMPTPYQSKIILEPSKPRVRLIWKLFKIPNTNSSLVWPKNKFDIRTKLVCSKVHTKPTSIKTLNYF